MNIDNAAWEETGPVWVDPAQGSKYGFPKIYYPPKDGDVNEWLLKEGYPKDMCNLPIRIWQVKSNSLLSKN